MKGEGVINPPFLLLHQTLQALCLCAFAHNSMYKSWGHYTYKKKNTVALYRFVLLLQKTPPLNSFVFLGFVHFHANFENFLRDSVKPKTRHSLRMATVPLVQWSQTRQSLSFKLPVNNIDKESIAVRLVSEAKVSISFRLQSVLNQPPRNYAVELDLYLPVDASQLQWFAKPGALLIDVAKAAVEVWPRLTKSSVKNHNIQIDWDRWEDLDAEEGDGSENEDNTRAKNMPMPSIDELLQHYPGMKPPPEYGGKKGVAQETSSFGWADFMALTRLQRWLSVYNLTLLVCWVGVGMRLVATTIEALLRKDLTLFLRSCYSRSARLVLFAQILALLEPVHAKLGFSRGSWKQALLLHTGRNMVLLLLLWLREPPRAVQDWGTAVLFMAWCIGEVLRYPVYFLSSTNREPPLGLVKARYTAPLFLLPGGFISELRVLYLISQSPVLPRFAQWPLLLYALLSYTVGAPYVYTSLMRQRQKKLVSNAKLH
eukprot:g60230.t1